MKSCELGSLAVFVDKPVRVDRGIDPRGFPPIPWGNEKVRANLDREWSSKTEGDLAVVDVRTDR